MQWEAEMTIFLGSESLSVIFFYYIFQNIRIMYITDALLVTEVGLIKGHFLGTQRQVFL